MFGFLKKLLGGEAAREPAAKPGTFGVGELSRRLGIREAELLSTPVTYHRFVIAKRTGGQRTILAPDPKLKAIQRRILHRLLRRLKAHPCATGFERGHSIVTNAIAHSGKEGMPTPPHC
jgi:RNA-directed DNA polymerase